MSSEDVTTILGEGSSFEGKLTFEGTVRIDGRFSGEIRTEGTLIVGERADIKADIQAAVVVVQGRLQGDVSASESLAIQAPARVEGNLSTPSLEIEQGSYFQGSCAMSRDEGSAASVAAAAPAAEAG
ncbi:polymer-forming cytoskeletal protein [Pseudenhygromyxa sp. WMMC2535]|uniref:bactofilin family protein n=1 Tax=Pseudenhygromyxa sp. WMMC2535 TaxID=2712867 RepID=UPI001557E03A|nr:polymer-forming cytoskeletal protein [Pseudenhygromyxa sp. WMMC2535]NVB40100.1 polymer-forming cytoskeletal protein [Pseudenhygromyxa sp. WMMC2535]